MAGNLNSGHSYLFTAVQIIMVNFYLQVLKANLKMVAIFMQCQIHPKIKKSKKGHNLKITSNQGPEDYLNPQNLDQEKYPNP